MITSRALKASALNLAKTSVNPKRLYADLAAMAVKTNHCEVCHEDISWHVF